MALFITSKKPPIRRKCATQIACRSCPSQLRKLPEMGRQAEWPKLCSERRKEAADRWEFICCVCAHLGRVLSYSQPKCGTILAGNTFPLQLIRKAAVCTPSVQHPTDISFSWQIHKKRFKYVREQLITKKFNRSRWHAERDTWKCLNSTEGIELFRRFTVNQ